MLSRRFFASVTRRNSTFHFKTTTTANGPNLLNPPTSFTPKSVVILSTPVALPSVIQRSIDLYQNEKLQVIVAGVDTIAPNSRRNGFSELWLKELVQIQSSQQLEEIDKKAPLRESDGINIVTAKTNWKNITSNFDLSIDESHTVNIGLANTLFQTSNLVTLFYFQPETEAQGPHAALAANSGHTLSSLLASLPPLLRLSDARTSDKWTPLYDSKEELVITKSAGNLVKEINGGSAAKYLENNARLMDIGSKETQVFVKLFKEGEEQPQRFEVIAGGGGWGVKANMLAISPEADIQVGDRIEFYMLTPGDRFEKDHASVESVLDRMVFECSHEDTQYNEGTDVSNEEYRVFGCGSERGFKLNGIKYALAGERLSVAVHQGGP